MWKQTTTPQQADVMISITIFWCGIWNFILLAPKGNYPNRSCLNEATINLNIVIAMISTHKSFDWTANKNTRVYESIHSNSFPHSMSPDFTVLNVKRYISKKKLQHRYKCTFTWKGFHKFVQKIQIICINGCVKIIITIYTPKPIPFQLHRLCFAANQQLAMFHPSFLIHRWRITAMEDL